MSDTTLRRRGRKAGTATPQKATIRREYLKILRQERAMTAPQLAAMLGLSARQHYLRYENGEREFGENVRDRYFLSLSLIFDMPISYFEQGEKEYLAAKARLSEKKTRMQQGVKTYALSDS